jgi:hypothetical protein
MKTYVSKPLMIMCVIVQDLMVQWEEEGQDQELTA